MGPLIPVAVYFLVKALFALPAWFAANPGPSILAGGMRVSLFAILMVGGIFAIGRGAQFFKERSQYYYGLTETSFALITAWNLVHDLASPQAKPSAWLGVIATVYLTSRGLDNYYKGKEKGEMPSTNRDLVFNSENDSGENTPDGLIFC